VTGAKHLPTLMVMLLQAPPPLDRLSRGVIARAVLDA